MSPEQEAQTKQWAVLIGLQYITHSQGFAERWYSQDVNRYGRKTLNIHVRQKMYTYSFDSFYTIGSFYS